MSFPSDLTSLLTGNPKLLSIIGALVFVLYVLKLSSEISQTVADKLGRLGRYWRRRGIAAAEQIAEARAAGAQRLTDVEAERDYAYEQLKNERRYSHECAEDREVMRDYITYDSGWHWRHEQKAASTGVVIDAHDEHVSYVEYAASARPDTPHPDPA